MKYIIIGCFMFSFAIGATIPKDSQAEITYYENTNDGAGNYRYSFQTSNGINREETGYLVNIGEKDEHLFVEGSYSYSDPDGKQIIVFYTADENGFHIVNSANRLAISVASALPSNAVASLLG